MREYFPKRDFPYMLPRNVYYQALYAVRDYDRMREEYTAVQLLPSGMGGSGGHSGVSDPTGRIAARRAELSDRLTAIDRALAEIPPEYRKGIADNVRYGAAYPYTAGMGTWSRYRRKFLFYVAKYLRLM